VMEMEYLQGIDLPAGKTVSLNPTGLHVWLANLNRPLKAGETIPLTLEFEKAGQRQINVPIIAPSAPPPNSGG
jgi:copper(I)-binding protein